MLTEDKKFTIQKRKEGFAVYEIREMLDCRYSVFQIAFICDQAKVLANQRRKTK